MIAVDIVVPCDASAADVETMAERWAQSARYSATALPGVSTKGARAVVVRASAAELAAAIEAQRA